MIRFPAAIGAGGCKTEAVVPGDPAVQEARTADAGIGWIRSG
jgi:hypothetical protein